jgi:hypothetical protein
VTTTVRTLAGELVELARSLERVNGHERSAAVWDLSAGVHLLYAAPGAPAALLEMASERLGSGETDFEAAGELGTWAVVHVCSLASEAAAYGLFLDGAGHPHVESTVAQLIGMAESNIGKPVGAMSRTEKQQVVRLLDERGAFLIRRAVEDVADRLGVTRFTIYNYLDRDR